MKGILQLIALLSAVTIGGGCVSLFLTLIMPRPNHDEHTQGAETWRVHRKVAPVMIKIGACVLVGSALGLLFVEAVQ